jgi:alpha-galactosidase
MKQLRVRHCAGVSLIFLFLLECAAGRVAFAQQIVPVAPTPPMGWNSWNHFADKISDAVIRAQADALVNNGMKAAGYLYVNIDGGWVGRRDDKGIIHPNDKFPDMKSLGDYIHSKGLKFGIYTAATPKECVGLDGSAGHEDQDARTFAEWGVDCVKVDWCPTPEDPAWNTTDDSLARVRFTKMGEALRKAGRPVVYSIVGPGSSWRWAASAGANLWRTSSDMKDNWNWMSNIGFSQNGLEQLAGPGHWNDPDALEVGNSGFDNAIIAEKVAGAWHLRRPAPPQNPGMTDEEYRTQMSLWCLLAAPLISGADISHLKPSALSILTNPEVIAVDQDSRGIQGHRVAQEGPLEEWMKPLADGSKAAGLFNREVDTVAVTAYFRDIGVGENAWVRDLWAGKDLGRFHEKYKVNVPGHGVTLIKVKTMD